MLRASANLLGLAWWARVESRNPDVTYWFGPFVRRSTLERELETFLSDLRSESPAVLEHQLLQPWENSAIKLKPSPTMTVPGEHIQLPRKAASMVQKITKTTAILSTGYSTTPSKEEITEVENRMFIGWLKFL